MYSASGSLFLRQMLIEKGKKNLFRRAPFSGSFDRKFWRNILSIFVFFFYLFF